MSQSTTQNQTSITNSSLDTVGAINNINNSLSAQQLSQGGVGLFNPMAAQRQQQQGAMNGMIGNTNPNLANFQTGNIANGMNMNGLMMNNMNMPGGNPNFNPSNMNPNAMNPNANLNNFNVNEFVRLQQQLQQQQLQQQMQQQIQQQQLQVGSGMNTANAQNMNFALMAAQQNQAQPNSNPASNNILQSFMGRNPQFAAAGGLPLQGQANPLIGQLMMNQQQGGLGGLGGLGAAALVGHNNLGAALPSMVANANTFQLPSPNSIFSRDASRRMRGGVIEPFPEKLHRLLLEVEAAGRADVISFVANGRAFAIHKADAFFKEIVPLYFRQSRLSSFKRQLNLYGFELINTGPARGGYYHEMFVKERPELCRRMRRVAVKVAPSKDGTPKKKGKNKTADTEDPQTIDPSPLGTNAEKEAASEVSKTGDAKEEVVGDDGEKATTGATEVSTEETTEQVNKQIEGKSNEEGADDTTKTDTETAKEEGKEGN